MAQEQPLPAQALSFHPEFLCDPPPWFIRELDFNTLRELAINAIEMHKSILEAQVRASDKSLAILANVKG